MTTLNTVGRNALLTVIVLLLGVATVAAFVRAGDDDGSRLAQTGSGTTTTVPAATSSTSSTSTTSTTSSASASTPPTRAPAGTTGAPTPTSTPASPAPGTGTGGSGLGTGGAGQVAMGPTIPNTGIESLLAPGGVLLGAGVALQVLVRGRGRRGDDAG